MPDLADDLNRLLKSLDDGRRTTMSKITESDPALGGLKDVTISELMPGTVVIRPDSDRDFKCPGKRGRSCGRLFRGITSPIFSTEATALPANRLCDAILLRMKGAESVYLDIAYMDLKGENPSGFSEQFRASRCFIRYALDLLNLISNEDEANYRWRVGRERFILLQPSAAGMARKAPIGIGLPQATSPSNPLKLRRNDGDQIRVSELFAASG